MPTKIQITIINEHPRVFMNRTQKVGYQQRTQSTAGAHPYRQWWEGTLLDYLKNSYSSATYVQNSFFEKSLSYSLASYLLGNASYDYYNQIRGHCEYAAANYSPTSKQDLRDLLLALCAFYDLCFDLMSVSTESAIKTKILSICDNSFSIPTGGNSAAKELMDGHTRIDQALTALAMIVIGETGLRLDRAIDFWYGGNAGVSYNGLAAMDTDRYYSASGGAGKGPHYQSLANYGVVWLMKALTTSTYFLLGGQLKLDGENYFPWDENWFKNAPLWFLNLGIRGDIEYFRFGDTIRQNNPIFNVQQRVNIGAMTEYGNYRKEAKWFYDQWQTKSRSLGQGTTYQRATDFLFIDNDNELYKSTPPSQTGLTKNFLVNPPGTIVDRNTWDLPISTIGHLQFTERYYRGHRDLDVGLLQICHREDMVVCNTGMYSTSSGETQAIPGGPHLLNYAKQSISKSGIPLCDDGAVTPHGNYDNTNAFVNLPSGEGGQYFKTYLGARDADNVDDMRNQGSGLGWLISEGTAPNQGVSLIGDDSSVRVYYANTKRAYLKESSDINTSAERFQICEHKIMYIKDQYHGVWFRVVRMKSRLASMIKQDHWHTWGNPVLGNFDSSGFFFASGYRMDQNIGNLGGKVFISYYDFANLRVAQTGGGTTTNFGTTQFFYDPKDGSGGRNYPPSFYNTTRHLSDIGRYRVSVFPKTQQQDDYFVCLIIPLDPSEPTPVYQWINSKTYFGVRFQDGKLYQLAKDTTAYISPGGAPDSTPPIAVSGVSASSPASQTANVLWSPIADDPTMDIAGKYKVYRRTP